VDTHKEVHYAEVQDEKRNVLWHGRIPVSRDGFLQLLEKIRTIEESNSQKIAAVYMNPTGNYHMTLKYFLEKNGFSGIIHMVDARRTVHLRNMINLGKEKSDPEDAHVLASTPFIDQQSLDRKDHERSPLSAITREMEIIQRNATRITNHIQADITAVFPEFTSVMAIDSKTGLAILEKYTVPENIAKLDPEKLLKFMQKNGRNHFDLEDARRLIDLASKTIGIPDPDGVYAFRMRMNVKRLKYEISALKTIEKEILTRSQGDQHILHLTEMKGIGTVSAATIVSEIGSIEQFESAVKLQSYGGKAPDMSGSAGKVHARGISRTRNSHLSNAIHESAVSLVLHRNHEFYELFTRELMKKKSKTEAYIVVGKRLLFHVYSMMKNSRPYRERKPGNTDRGRGSLPV
jgi:transposase